MEIKVTPARPEQLRKRPADESNLGFGDIVTDHMFLMNYEQGKGWHNPRIEPYHSLAIDPAAMSIHYGQLIFEGLKAYRGKDGSIYLFRAKENFLRFNRSAARICMPEVEIEPAMDAMKKLILLDKEWVPRNPGTSLYIRPAMLATEPHLGVRPANSYLFFIIVGPVGAYYKEGLNPVKIYVEDKYIRAAVGGLGRGENRGQLRGQPPGRRGGQEEGVHPGAVAGCGRAEVRGGSGHHEHVLRRGRGGDHGPSERDPSCPASRGIR